MVSSYSGNNLDLLLAGDNPEFLSSVNGVVKKLNFQLQVLIL
jgi:hypothetical protein